MAAIVCCDRRSKTSFTRRGSAAGPASLSETKKGGPEAAPFVHEAIDRPAGLPLVGVAGFEPATPTSRTWCATRLRYTPPREQAACIAAVPAVRNPTPMDFGALFRASRRTALRSPKLAA